MIIRKVNTEIFFKNNYKTTRRNFKNCRDQKLQVHRPTIIIIQKKPISVWLDQSQIEMIRNKLIFARTFSFKQLKKY